MKRGRVWLYTALGALALSFYAPSAAQAWFGFEWVEDIRANGTLSAIWKSDLSILEKVTASAREASKMVRQGEAMAHAFGRERRMNWRGAIYRGTDDYTRNRYGETPDWARMIRGEPQLARGAWEQATVAVGEAAPSYFSNQRAELGTVEMVDGSIPRCLETIAGARQAEQQNAQAYAALDEDALDDSPLANSFIGQLNLVNAQQAQAREQGRTGQAIAACAAEQTMLANKMQRDLRAEALNSTVAEQRAISERSSYLADPTDVELSWLPGADPGSR